MHFGRTSPDHPVPLTRREVKGEERGSGLGRQEGMGVEIDKIVIVC